MSWHFTQLHTSKVHEFSIKGIECETVRVGDTPRAWAAYQRMDSEWKIAPDDATYKLIARLLAQGLRLADLQGVISRAKSDPKAPPGGGGKGTPPCQFWLGGMARQMFLTKSIECDLTRGTGLQNASGDMASNVEATLCSCLPRVDR